MTPVLKLQLVLTDAGWTARTPHTPAARNCQTSGILPSPWMWSAISVTAELTITYEWTSINIYFWLWLPRWWAACLWAWPVFPLGCLSSHWFIGVLYVFCVLIHYLLCCESLSSGCHLSFNCVYGAFSEFHMLIYPNWSFSPLCLHFCFILESVLYCEVIEYVSIL